MAISSLLQPQLPAFQWHLPSMCLAVTWFYVTHSLVGWILGALFCVRMMFLLFNKTKESGNFNISHYTRLSTQSELTQRTILCSFFPSVCLYLTLSLLFSPLFSFFAVSSQGLLFCWPTLAKSVILIRLVGPRSEEFIEKSFTGLL